MSRRRAAGSSLAMVLVVISLAFVVVGLLIDGVFFGIFSAGRLAAENNARNAADSVVASTIEHVMATLGPSPSASPPVSVVVGWSGAELTASASVAFAVPPGSGPTVPLSTDNLLGAAATNGSLAQVPAYSLDVVGAGTCGGSAARSEALLYIPPYPYAIVSAGPISSQQGLTVAGVAQASSLQANLSQIPASQLLPADMASNSALPFYAVQAGAPTSVSGDVLACGGIHMPPAAVAGGTLSGSEAAVIPQIDVTKYKPPAAKIYTTLPAQDQSRTLVGYCFGSGYAVQGDLTLDSSVLYVQGDLTVHGALLGNGAVFVTGNTLIEAGQTASDLTGNNVVALAGQGDVTLQANGRQSNFFRGLIYCEGNFTASKITLMGSFMEQANPSGASTQMTLDDVGVVHVPQYTAGSFKVLLPPPPPSNGPGATVTFQTIPPIEGGPSPKMVVSYDTQYCCRVAQTSQGLQVQFFEAQQDPLNGTPPPPQQVPCFVVGGVHQMPPYTLDASRMQIVLSQTPFDCIEPQVLSFVNGASQTQCTGSNGTTELADTQRMQPATITYMVDSLLNQIQGPTGSTSGGAGSGSAAGQTETFSYDLNQFIAVADRMRLLMWRRW